MSRVVVARGHPGHFRFTQVVRHPPKDLSRVCLHIANPVCILRRNDEPEVVAIFSPGRRHSGRVQVIRSAVEEVWSLVIETGPGTTEVSYVRGKCGSTNGSLTKVARDQRLHDGPLANVQTEGAARASLS